MPYARDRFRSEPICRPNAAQSSPAARPAKAHPMDALATRALFEAPSVCHIRTMPTGSPRTITPASTSAMILRVPTSPASAASSRADMKGRNASITSPLTSVERP